MCGMLMVITFPEFPFMVPQGGESRQAYFLHSDALSSSIQAHQNIFFT